MPGTKKDAGTAIRASKLSPVGLLRVQDGLILLAAASGRKLVARENLRPSILCEAPRASQTCVCLKTCVVQFLVKHRVFHKRSPPLHCNCADEVRESQNPSKSTGSTIAAIVRLDVSKVELFGGRVQRKRLVAVFPSSDGPILSGSLCFRYCL